MVYYYLLWILAYLYLLTPTKSLKSPFRTLMYCNIKINQETLRRSWMKSLPKKVCMCILDTLAVITY